MYDNKKIISICEITSEDKRILRRADLDGSDITPLYLDGTYKETIDYQKEYSSFAYGQFEAVWNEVLIQ